MTSFATQIIAWQRQQGRKNLPWQIDRSPYSVWLSEVMLQQTQVATVLNFYPQFLAKFPTAQVLAKAPLDDVLALWSGMGYYARARNLHRAAIQVVNDFGGEFPKTAKELELLIGVGRSTAAAIAAFCYGERVAILDGNVKRVLTRVLAFEGDLAKAPEVNRLWEIAGELLPTINLKKTMPAYTQGLMDMGATLCHARRPECKRCPVAGICRANQAETYDQFPVKTKKLKRSTESIWLLLAERPTREVLLVQKPLQGVWAGLHSLPAFECEEALLAALPIAAQPNAAKQKAAHQQLNFAPAFKHVLTHKDLWLHVVQFVASSRSKLSSLGTWYSRERAMQLGLPAPIRKILTTQH